jgi:arylsulfatase A-like enzyme
MSAGPHIFVIISHDLGQHLGCYGETAVRSPHIDALAARGTRFTRSFCTAPQCSPSRAALWTGRFPHANGVVGLTHADFANDFHPEERHLAQILGEGGYETHLFGIQHESRSAARCGYANVHPTGSCAQVADHFARFMRDWEDAGVPLFAQIGFFEPHRPFPHEGVTPQAPAALVVPPYLPDISRRARGFGGDGGVDRGDGRSVRTVFLAPCRRRGYWKTASSSSPPTTGRRFRGRK